MITNMLEAIGRTAIGALERCGRFAIFAMQTMSALTKRPNRKHITVQMERIGVNSLPIVLLTALFTGMVLSIQIAHEFIRYGAQSTIGGIVAIAMCRELAPVLTGVVVAGRVGASITAELGSMRVTEQIDALRVMGTNPIRYLVVPRLWSGMFMLPILVLFADAVGTMGGYLIATAYFDISGFTFINSIQTYTTIHDFLGGMVKSIVFGAIVAMIGCYRGMYCANGAEGVGRATTESVVTSIILIFMTNCIMSAIWFR